MSSPASSRRVFAPACKESTNALATPPCRPSDRRSACRLVDPDRRRPRLVASQRRRHRRRRRRRRAHRSRSGHRVLRLGVPLGDLWSDRPAAATRPPCTTSARSATSSTRTRGPNSYTGWDVNTGGVHIESGGVNLFNLGTVTLPQVGVNFGGHIGERFDGDIVSSTAVTEGRVAVNAFQIETVYPDPRARFRATARSSSARSRRRRAVAADGRPGWAGPAATSCSSPTRPRAGRSRRTRTSGSAPRRRSTSTRSVSGSTTARTSRAGPVTTSGIVPPDPADAHPRHALRRRHHERSDPQWRRSHRHARPQHPARRDRQPRAQGHRRRRRARGGGFGRAAQRHGRRSAWPRLRRGDAEGGRLLWRPGDLRRPGIGPGWRAGHVEPQRRRRRHRAEPRARPRRCRREDPHLQLVGARPTWSPTSPAGSTPAVLNANGSGFTGVTPSRIFDSRNDIGTTGGVVRRGRDPFGAGRRPGRRPVERDVGRGQHHCHRSRRAPDSRRRSRPASRSRSRPTSTTSRARRGPTSPSSRSAPVGRSRSTRPRHRSHLIVDVMG